MSDCPSNHWNDGDDTCADCGKDLNPPDHVNPPLSVGWQGWYTRKGGTVWYFCTVIGIDGGDPVIKTTKGHYHRRPTDQYNFSRHRPSERTESSTH